MTDESAGRTDDVLPPLPEGRELVAMVRMTPALLFSRVDAFDPFFAQIRNDTDAAVTGLDASDAKDREAIKSAAFRLVKTRTAIEATAKRLNEEAQAQINARHAKRRDMCDRLDAYADEIRQPAVDWEAAEKERQADVKAVIDHLRAAATVAFGTTAEQVSAKITDLKALAIDEAVFRERTDEARAAREDAIDALRATRDQLVAAEAERDELARLRAEAAKRLEEAAAAARREQARLAKEARERAIAEAEEARKAEEAERVRIAQERAKQEAEWAAAEALAEERRRHQAELDRVAAEAARQERLRVEVEAAQERDRQDRERDAAHRMVVIGEAVASLVGVAFGKSKLSAAAATAVVNAIVGGDVAHVRIEF